LLSSPETYFRDEIRGGNIINNSRQATIITGIDNNNTTYSNPARSNSAEYPKNKEIYE
jgi:hypothetical protein